MQEVVPSVQDQILISEKFRGFPSLLQGQKKENKQPQVPPWLQRGFSSATQLRGKEGKTQYIWQYHHQK